MRTAGTYIFIFLIGLIGALPAMAQENEGQTLLDRLIDRFRKTNGVWVQYEAQSSEGTSVGYIQLKGNKFLLKSSGMITWFDGQTQWTYLEANDEVNISEPALEDLQTLSPLAWIELYRNGGYTVQMESSGQRASVVVMTTDDASREWQCIRLYVEKAELRPLELSMRSRSSQEDIVIRFLYYEDGKDYPDSLFTFNPKEYPTAEVIDLR